MARLIVFVLLAAVVATASTTAAQGSRQATPAAETQSRSRVTVTVQELIQRDHRLPEAAHPRREGTGETARKEA
jgi:Ni/Co efflux regulator RcnB